jgi:hypothetical protein
MSLTDEMVKELDKEIIESKGRLKYWKSTTPKEQFVSDLDSLTK